MSSQTLTCSGAGGRLSKTHFNNSLFKNREVDNPSLDSLG